MNRVEFEAKAKSEFHIKNVGRALYVSAWDLPKVRIDFFDSGDSYEQKGAKVTLSSGNDCIMRVPADSSVIVGNIGADANVKGISGVLKVQRVGGSLHLKRLGDVEIKSVAGNLTGRDIAGDMKINEVMGNANLRNVQGDLSAKMVSANFELRQGGDNVDAEAMGNAKVRSELGQKASYRIKCAGNAYCRLEGEEDVKATLKSGAEQILVLTPTQNQSLQAREHVLTLGEGKASVQIEAGGHIDFQAGNPQHKHFEFGQDLDFGYDLDSNLGGMVGEISEQISGQLEAQLESLENQLESLSDHIQTTSSAGLQKAQQRIAEAQRRMEQRMRARAPGTARKPRTGASAGGPQPDPVTDEERMKVLEMVQEKKITVDEAEVLLATLEGRKIERKTPEESEES